MQSSDAFTPQYGTLVYNGFWFSPEREALQALVTETQRDVTGVVRLKLYKGNIIVAGRKSPKSLYDSKIATMEGSLTTIPFPFANTRVLAVPRSMAKSDENRLKRERRFITDGAE